MTWHNAYSVMVAIGGALIFYEVMQIVVAVRRLLEALRAYVMTRDISEYRDMEAKKALRERSQIR